MSCERRPIGEHLRRFNDPITNEVAVLMVGDRCENRDIVIHHKQKGIQRINELNRAYDPLQYPLIFFLGQDGYTIDLKSNNDKKISSREFYASRLMSY